MILLYLNAPLGDATHLISATSVLKNNPSQVENITSELTSRESNQHFLLIDLYRSGVPQVGHAGMIISVELRIRGMLLVTNATQPVT
jgi:hypothetical protein